MLYAYFYAHHAPNVVNVFEGKKRNKRKKIIKIIKRMTSTISSTCQCLQLFLPKDDEIERPFCMRQVEFP